jgi:hypothetical protein
MLWKSSTTMTCCAAAGLASWSSLVAAAGIDTYSVAVATVAFDGPLEPQYFLGYSAFAIDDASDGDGPVVGSPSMLRDADGEALFESTVLVTDLGVGAFRVVATLSAIAGTLFDSIPASAMTIDGEGGPWSANAFNYTVGNILGFPDVERDGVDIGTEWAYVAGEVRLSSADQDWVFDHMQFFHPSEFEGASLTDVHLGYNLAMGLLESTGANSMTITVEVVAVPTPAAIGLFAMTGPIARRRRH